MDEYVRSFSDDSIQERIEKLFEKVKEVVESKPYHRCSSRNRSCVQEDEQVVYTC